ncbi:MAG: hypothetical protein K9M49_09650 [Candidatus Marinimicrobia bacterium]|nr:hypothetical protein [Candidatus Neomarinimicrobiota bacterium]MCF7851540.1 hypothetical protein [Candidatus Neomarinimicrobiota bacterium]MCF7905397.1 hypothetical protein [Candidatus Neomarinimicrobiota bacterium]
MARAIIDAYNVMDCQVMNVGANDLAGGTAFIKEMQAKANFPFISSNIKLKDAEENLFQPYLIKEMNGLKIGFVGVCSPVLRLNEFEFKDPVESVEAIVNEIEEKVDLLVVLANVDDKTELALAETITDIDFLIRSKSGSLYRNPKSVGNVTVIRNGKQGKFAGILSIKMNDTEKPLVNISREMSRIDFANKRLETMRKDLKKGETLEEKYKDNKSRMNVLNRLKSEKEKNRKIIKTHENTFFYNPRSLNDAIEDEPEVAAIVEVYMPKTNSE